MDKKLQFLEEDKEKVVKFLNSVAKNAEFKLTTNELIKHFKLLAYMEQTLLSKIDANVLEVKRIVEDEKEGEKESSES